MTRGPAAPALAASGLTVARASLSTPVARSRRRAVSAGGAIREVIYASPRARQQIIRDRVVFGPVLEYAYLVSIGPRLEVDNLNVLPQNPYTAPYEELRIRAR